MNRISALVLMSALGAVYALPADADAGHQHSAGAAAPAAAKANAEVRKVDMDAGTVTIKHGPIVNMDMPAMTMAYRVKDKAMLDGLKPGDKIQFEAGNVGGAFTLTSIVKVK